MHHLAKIYLPHYTNLNPAANINDIEKVEIVFQDGVGYDSTKLFDSIKGRYGQY